MNGALPACLFAWKTSLATAIRRDRALPTRVERQLATASINSSCVGAKSPSIPWSSRKTVLATREGIHDEWS
jgi:hypothetical protein